MGVDQLPKPSDIREYEIYDPNPPRSGEAVSKELANQVLDAVKTGVTDLDALAGLAYTVKTSHSMGLYLGPKAIVEEFQRGAQHAIPDWLKAVGSVLNPISGMIRRQVIGLGIGSAAHQEHPAAHHPSLSGRPPESEGLRQRLQGAL